MSQPYKNLKIHNRVFLLLHQEYDTIVVSGAQPSRIAPLTSTLVISGRLTVQFMDIALSKRWITVYWNGRELYHKTLEGVPL